LIGRRRLVLVLGLALPALAAALAQAAPATAAAAPAASPLPAAASPPPEAATTLLGAALFVAETAAVPRMRDAEKDLTWRGDQLGRLTRLYARAGRYDAALRFVQDLEELDPSLAPALAQIALAALRAGDLPRARALAARIAALDETGWRKRASFPVPETTGPALAEIAAAMCDAGWKAEAAGLVAAIHNPSQRGEAYLHMGRVESALETAGVVLPGVNHVPPDAGPFWAEDAGRRQELLLHVIDALVERNDLPLAHRALAAMGSPEDPGAHGFRAWALVEIARRERPAETLAQALREIEQTPDERLGDVVQRVDVMSLIARGLAAADLRPQAAAVLDKARAEAGAAEEVSVDWAASTVYQTLAVIAGAELALGDRQAAVGLLDRAARYLDRIPVPVRKEGAAAYENKPASIHTLKASGKALIAAWLERAGGAERAKATLGSALAEIAAIDDAEWRMSAWLSLVGAYAKGNADRPDRAIEILASRVPAGADANDAIVEIPAEELLAAPRELLWRLLDSMPPDPPYFSKTRVAASLAAKLPPSANREDATRLTTIALSALAGKGEDWELSLVALAGEAPGADLPATPEQRVLLRRLLDLPAGR
jgi:tetratricopeptide (TPR) repeat protein